MQEQDLRDRQPRPSAPWKVIAGLAAVVFLAGGGVAFWTWHSVTSDRLDPSAPANQINTEPSDSQTAVPQTATAEVYWLDVEGTGFKLVPVPVQVNRDNRDPNALLTTSFEKLLSGQTDSTAFSEVPTSTNLLSVEVRPDGVHVDLSQDFTQGGGSASMTGRLAQVVYTATSLDPDAPVWISVEGKPLEVLGGEGILVDQPITRSNVEENFSF